MQQLNIFGRLIGGVYAVLSSYAVTSGVVHGRNIPLLVSRRFAVDGSRVWSTFKGA